MFFFFNDTATTEIYTLSLHDALPICQGGGSSQVGKDSLGAGVSPPGLFAACAHGIVMRQCAGEKCQCPPILVGERGEAGHRRAGHALRNDLVQREHAARTGTITIDRKSAV